MPLFRFCFLCLWTVCLYACSPTPQASISGQVFYTVFDPGKLPSDSDPKLIDAGALIKLYPLDKGTDARPFVDTTDVNGTFRIDKIPAGSYFLLVRSAHATDCPMERLAQFRQHSNALQQLFGLDLSGFRSQLEEIRVHDSLYQSFLHEEPLDSSCLGLIGQTFEANMEKMKISTISARVLDSLPSAFKQQIGLNANDGNAFDLMELTIGDSSRIHHVSDLGRNCRSIYDKWKDLR